MRKLILLSSFSLLLALTACDGSDSGGATKTGGLFGGKKIEISDVYSFETPGKFSAAAVFMTIENGTKDDDKMVAFETSYGQRAELHTMEAGGTMMRMRQVESYKIPSGETHVLQPGADHVMIFGISNKLGAGQSFEGKAVFEKAGEIPVTVQLRPRSEMNMEK